jgi:hypothetical protein
MNEGKWAKNIITTHHHMTPPAREGYPDLHHILGLTDDIIKGAFVVNCCWMFANEKPGYMAAHAHPYDEVIGFIGTDMNNVNDLGAEMEIWMDDERYVSTSSNIIYIPKGLKHCPLDLRNIIRPIFHFDIQITDKVRFL